MFEQVHAVTVDHSSETDLGQHSKDADLIDVDISDLQSIFDTPRKVVIKRQLKKYMWRNLEKSKKIRSLQKQNARLKRKNTSLVDIMKELRNKKLISTEIEAALGVTPELAEIYRLQILNYRQRKNKSLTKKRRPLYLPAIRKFAMTFNFYSPAAYKYVRRKFNCCLPHPRTLSKW